MRVSNESSLPAVVTPFSTSEYFPGRVSRLAPASPYQTLPCGSEEKNTSCASHFPESDFNRSSEVTRITTGDPLTGKTGCQRTEKATALRFGWEAGTSNAPKGSAPSHATASRMASLLRLDSANIDNAPTPHQPSRAVDVCGPEFTRQNPLSYL